MKLLTEKIWATQRKLGCKLGHTDESDKYILYCQFIMSGVLLYRTEIEKKKQHMGPISNQWNNIVLARQAGRYLTHDVSNYLFTRIWFRQRKEDTLILCCQLVWLFWSWRLFCVCDIGVYLLMGLSLHHSEINDFVTFVFMVLFQN